ncbi:MAG TPA: hypothetical protein VFI29_09620 [Hanamia sp.]|nr:hypothetical protein [Hanamia sp.]
MKAIKSKALFFGLSLFAFTAIQAQDTTTTPKPDTTKPKKDSTVMVNFNKVNSENTAIVTTSFVTINDNKAVAKLEAIDNKKVI